MIPVRTSRLTTTITTLPRLDPDVALVRQFRATGDSRLFEALFRKYQTPVFHLVHRMVNGEDAYDLTQEVFYRALRALPTFKGDSKFSTWLFTITKNVCLNHLRDQNGAADLKIIHWMRPVSRAKPAAGLSLPI